MPKLSSVSPIDNLVVLACGKGGCGKTTALASLPKPIYIFDIDQRIKGIKGSNIISESEQELIDFDFYEASKGWSALEQKWLEFSIKYDKRELKYKTLIIESADQLCEMLLIDAFRQKTKQPTGIFIPASKIPKENRGGTNILGDVQIPTPDEYRYAYGTFRHMFYNWFKHFRNVNIVLSAGTTPVWGKPPGETNPYAQDVVLGRKILAPQQLADLLPRMFDEVWEFNKKEVGTSLKFEVSFRSDIAKTCLVSLPNSLDLTGKNFWNEISKYFPKAVSDKPEIAEAKA